MRLDSCRVLFSLRSTSTEAYFLSILQCARLGRQSALLDLSLRTNPLANQDPSDPSPWPNPRPNPMATATSITTIATKRSRRSSTTCIWKMPRSTSSTKSMSSIAAPPPQTALTARRHKIGKFANLVCPLPSHPPAFQLPADMLPPPPSSIPNTDMTRNTKRHATPSAPTSPSPTASAPSSPSATATWSSGMSMAATTSGPSRKP